VRHLRFVRDHQDGDAVLAVERDEQVHDLVAALAVEVAGRLVGEQDQRAGDDGAGDGDALLLAAGKFGRRVMFPAGQADLRQRFARGGVAVRRLRRDRAAAVRRSPAPRCARAG
jgi:hypothetical protein